MNKAFIPLALFLSLAGLFYYVLGLMNDGIYNPKDIPTEFIGKKAPAFSLPDLLNPEQIVTPAALRGQVWLLNIWGTWCPECWREHGYLLFLKSKGINIVGINWRDEAKDSRQMISQQGNPFSQIGFDPDSSAVIDWGVYGAPETFLIDAEGIVREKHKGGMNPRVWAKKFAPYFVKQQ